jgi:hypothetical protein
MRVSLFVYRHTAQHSTQSYGKVEEEEGNEI